MIGLPVIFRKYGEDFEQLYKDSEIVIYKTTLPSLEIFKYKVSKPDKYHDDIWEKYPSESSFGSWAWCATCREQFDRILSTHFALSNEKRQICENVCPF